MLILRGHRSVRVMMLACLSCQQWNMCLGRLLPLVKSMNKISKNVNFFLWCHFEFFQNNPLKYYIAYTNLQHLLHWVYLLLDYFILLESKQGSSFPLSTQWVVPSHSFTFCLLFSGFPVSLVELEGLMQSVILRGIDGKGLELLASYKHKHWLMLPYYFFFKAGSIMMHSVISHKLPLTK